MKAMKLINTIAFVAMIVINALANLIPIGGKTTGQVSASYPNLFTPAPITFAIWGVIYILLAGFILYQWGLFDSGVFSTPLRKDVGIWFVVTCILNIAWIFCWHTDSIGLSVICIAALLVSLVILNRTIKDFNDGTRGIILVRAGFEIYFGWIIAATIANISVFLTKIEWGGFGISSTIWMIILLAAATVIAILAITIDHKYFSALAIAWALTGILIRQFSSTGFDGAYPAIIVADIIGILAIICTIAIVLDRIKMRPAF